LDDVNNFRSFFQKSKSLTAVGLGNLISNAISSIFWLYIASVLGKEGYGELGYLLATVGTAGAFALLGSNSTLPVYVAKGVKIQATVFFITLVAGVVASVILLGITQNIFASFYPLAFVVFSVIVYDYLGRKAFVNYAKYMIIQRILMVIFSLIFLQFWEIDGIIFGYTLSLGVFSFLVYKGFKEGKIQLDLLKSRATFIVNSYTNHILSVSSITIDKMLIFNLFGASILGPYQLGFQVFALIMMLPHIVTLYTLPHDASGSKNLPLKKHTLIIAGILTVLAITLSPFVVPIIFPDFIETIDVIQIMSLAVIPTTFNIIITSELLGNEKSKIVALGSIISIVSLFVGILLFGEFFGLRGMAFSLVISRTLECLFLFIMKKRLSI
jgi:O-antigen/teichoic acid export membrane protein